MAKTTKTEKPGAMKMAQAGNMKLAGPAKTAVAGNMKLANPAKPEKPAKNTSAKKKT